MHPLDLSPLSATNLNGWWRLTITLENLTESPLNFQRLQLAGHVHNHFFSLNHQDGTRGMVNDVIADTSQ